MKYDIKEPIEKWLGHPRLKLSTLMRSVGNYPPSYQSGEHM